MSSERSLSLLKELTEAHSVPGFENEVRKIFVNEHRGLGTLGSDKNGSVYCERDGAGPRVLVEGHMDEVGFRVQNITPSGYIQFINLGGWWTHNLLSQRVEILTKSGEKILGTISSQPPHFLSKEARDQVLPLEALRIDVGATSKLDLIDNFGVSIGDPIAPVSAFTKLARHERYMAKAFDNRVGIAGAIQTAEDLKEEKLPNTLITAGATMEEIGLRGAKTLAAKIKPDVAIVLECPPADDAPGMTPSESQGRLGGGVQLRLQDPSAMMNPRLADFAIETARAANIPHQVTVRRSGGTDAGAYHLANEGIPSIVLGTPARYIHSHNAILELSDYLAMLALTKELVRRLDQAAVDSLTDFL